MEDCVADGGGPPDDTPDDGAGSDTSSPSVVVFGSVNVDRTQRLSGEPSDTAAACPAPGETVTVDSPPAAFTADATALGGKGANQAVAAARAGVDTTLVGAVGVDAAAFGVRERLAAEGVETRLATRETETGAAYIWVTPDGENRIAVLPGANGTVTDADAQRAASVARNAAVLLLQNEIPVAAATALLDELHAAGENDGTGGDEMEAASDDDSEDPLTRTPVVIVDPAPAAGAESLVDHPRVDVFVPNEPEFDALRTELAVASARGAVVVRTEAADGASVFVGGHSPTPFTEPSVTVDAPSVDVVDTTGAGDAFAGYLAATLGSGESADRAASENADSLARLRHAVARGVWAGSRSCEREGAMTAPAPAPADET